MAVIKRFDAGKPGSEIPSPENYAPIPGPEKYAPPQHREKQLNDVEAEIRRVASLARLPGNDPAAEKINGLIQRISGASIEEIDQVIFELQGVREMLRNEGERVSRAIANYVSLSYAATTAMKVITDSLRQWQSVPSKPDPRSVN